MTTGNVVALGDVAEFGGGVDRQACLESIGSDTDGACPLRQEPDEIRWTLRIGYASDSCSRGIASRLGDILVCVQRWSVSKCAIPDTW